MTKEGDKTMKKAWVFVFFIITLILLSGCSNAERNKISESATVVDSTEIAEQTEVTTEIPTEAETVDDSWKDSYINYFNNYENSDGFEFALVNVDGDGIPELYEHAKHRPASSKLSWIYQGEVCSQWLMIDGFEYIESENLFMSTGIQSGIQADFVYMINGNETMELSQGTASRMIQGQERYNWNGEEVSESEYNTLRTAVFDSSKANTVDNFFSADEMVAKIENY